LATEVAAALVAWHRSNAADCPLYAYVAVDNPASRRVLEKLEFEFISREDYLGVPCELFRLPGDR
jgi:RimJ/RimL family protein N-acetyltransferase